MSKFQTVQDVTAYPAVTFYPRPYEVTFKLNYSATPLIPHVAMSMFHAGLDIPAICEVPFTLRDAKRLRDWLNTYIDDREGILR